GIAKTASDIDVTILIQADDVSLDDVVRTGVEVEQNLARCVARDDVARAGAWRGRQAADRVVVRATGEGHAVAGVRKCRGAGRVGAEVIPLDQVARRVDPEKMPTGGVAADHVAGPGRGSADGIAS